MLVGGRMRKMKTWKLCLLLLAVVHMVTPSSAQSASTTTTTTTSQTLRYLSRPTNSTVAIGQPAVFVCGVPKASPNINFTLYGGHGNYSLTCPGGRVEDIPQALYGSCEQTSEESVALWTIKGTSFSDNGTKVVCQQLNNPTAVFAVLHVYDSGTSYYILIGCVIGGFFGILLVFGLLFIMLQRSETFQRCFVGSNPEDDLETIVTEEEKEEKPKKSVKKI